MPKTYNNLWEKVVEYENLHKAFLAARKGKRYQLDVLNFSERLEENLIDIQNHLMWKSWSPGKYKSFITHEPKKRFIQAPPFKDRVVHHALVQIIEPLFEKKFIYHSYACRRGKGTHGAVAKTQAYLKIAAAKWGNESAYVLKADISKYFPSVNHRILMKILKKTIRDKDVLWLCGLIIYKGGVGGFSIPVGALTSQLFANIYLDQLDHFMKDQLGLPYYIRYMDDFIVFGPDKHWLRKAMILAVGFITDELQLRMNPKTQIFPIRQGVDFCGYRMWPTHALPRKRNVKRAKLRFLKLTRQYSDGVVGLRGVFASVSSFVGYMKHCSSYTTTKNILTSIRLMKNKSEEGN
ncbi:hypothetical protein DO021_19725 [Desulfobacter hydrogenophilus]|uniref:Reverse transcriptase domain-containing protein n=1 Tax=Desulfobacter hydrogenophilus TaxID=2291 RepID=A0A328F821_9BACT|nr:reverse transcriptase/maturase family protein [Desulfobacter hydrogenophilus]NDY73998.1 hypothetical protein [Desulfobacter hydrogenophilus]QBH14344.1 hypothetical protein EYB58_16325 [Desulfobacter hydrogenophilus]RAM00346.1 hypothetical protein DO021_19725 [Desulfobacter hydrogenophilus]